MGKKPIHSCQCEICQSVEPHPDLDHHRLMNLFASRLDEQQRRWYVGMEAERIGHGGTELMAKITGMKIDTIRKGRRELADNLANRPTERIRLPGGGRKPVEKKAQTSNRL